MFSSHTVLEVATHVSEFHYQNNGGTDRVLKIVNPYEDAVSIPALPAPAVFSLDDFEELVNAVHRWMARTQALFDIKVSRSLGILQSMFAVGPSDGQTWEASSTVELAAATMAFSYAPNTGVVLHPRPALVINWADLAYRNDLSFQMIEAARTGHRPRLGARAIGPSGPPGPAGPSDPLVAWPVEATLLTATPTSPAGYLGGTWALLDSGPLLGGSSGTMWAWKRTA